MGDEVLERAHLRAFMVEAFSSLTLEGHEHRVGCFLAVFGFDIQRLSADPGIWSALVMCMVVAGSIDPWMDGDGSFCLFPSMHGSRLWITLVGFG